jgi:hypothetical protein
VCEPFKFYCMHGLFSTARLTNKDAAFIVVWFLVLLHYWLHCPYTQSILESDGGSVRTLCLQHMLLTSDICMLRIRPWI